jgi:hypothetical protein
MDIELAALKRLNAACTSGVTVIVKRTFFSSVREEGEGRGVFFIGALCTSLH